MQTHQTSECVIDHETYIDSDNVENISRKHKAIKNVNDLKIEINHGLKKPAEI